MDDLGELRRELEWIKSDRIQPMEQIHVTFDKILRLTELNMKIAATLLREEPKPEIGK